MDPLIIENGSRTNSKHVGLEHFHKDFSTHGMQQYVHTGKHYGIIEYIAF